VGQDPAATITEHFSELEDPRRYNRRHLLHDIIVIAICAAICGADDWVAVADFGRAKQSWFEEFLELPHGIPSHDTFGDVFKLLDPEQFRRFFIQWVQAVNETTGGQVVPIDGKKLRRSHDKTLGKNAIHMVSAWASENHVVLGQIKVDDKSNEITAIPQLLDLLEISGCIVTIDAMGCQKEIARKIVKEKDADYVLALKGNQGGLFEDVKSLFERARKIGFANCKYHRTEEKGHGRLEVRECWTLSDPEYLASIRSLADWSDLQTIIMVKSERLVNDKRSEESRYYIASLSGDAEQASRAVRGHWGIENKVHWVLDIAFREDECRIRKGNGAQNFAVLRHIALNLLKQEKTAKCGIKNKRLKAGWDESYLLRVLSG
jgi:predicted transposase YbfD/YdcC